MSHLSFLRAISSDVFLKMVKATKSAVWCKEEILFLGIGTELLNVSFKFRGKEKKDKQLKEDTSGVVMTRYRILIWVCGYTEQKGGMVSLWYPAEHSPSPAVLANLFPRSCLTPSSGLSIINQITSTKLSSLIEILIFILVHYSFFSPLLSSQACPHCCWISGGPRTERDAADPSSRNRGIRLMI